LLNLLNFSLFMLILLLNYLVSVLRYLARKSSNYNNKKHILCYLVFESLVWFGFLMSKWGNHNCNWFIKFPNKEKTGLDCYGPVFCSLTLLGTVLDRLQPVFLLPGYNMS
jgi:hypothetical protein